MIATVVALYLEKWWKIGGAGSGIGSDWEMDDQGITVSCLFALGRLSG